MKFTMSKNVFILFFIYMNFLDLLEYLFMSLKNLLIEKRNNVANYQHSTKRIWFIKLDYLFLFLEDKTTLYKHKNPPYAVKHSWVKIVTALLIWCCLCLENLYKFKLKKGFHVQRVSWCCFIEDEIYVSVIEQLCVILC